MQDAISDLVTPWVIAYVFAVVASTIAIFIKVREFWQQLRWARSLGIPETFLAHTTPLMPDSHKFLDAYHDDACPQVPPQVPGIR